MSSAAAEPVVRVTDLRKEYGQVTAVDGVSFEIMPDEVFALVGPNGAGKTTAVEMLECLRTPTGGTATVLSHDLGADPRAIKSEIGVVPQSFHTFDRLTVRENVALARRMYDDGIGVEAVLDRLELMEYADTRFSALSGGYKRRTGIAMALASDPSILFLDEPTTGLDPAARRTTWAQIERLRELGTTVVLTTHYMEEVERLADRAALLVDGSLVAVDAVSKLIDDYGGDVKLVVETGRHGEAVAGEVESILRAAAGEVYRNETGDLVGLFGQRDRAQETFGRLQEAADGRSINLTTAGMDDVFLQLAGEAVDGGGDLR
ncbi:MAG: ABC transporter ATP-binding protein [Halobacteriales archaeon]